MKVKTYTGDLSKLKSCIKVSGPAGVIYKVIKKLISGNVPFELTDDLSVFIRFGDYLRSGISSIRFKEAKVCEHIEPLNLDIALVSSDYVMNPENEFYIHSQANSYTISYASIEEDKVRWYCGVYGMIDKDIWKERLSPFEKNNKKDDMILFRRYQTNVAVTLFRRGLIDENTYKGVSHILNYNPKELKYYGVN